MRAESERFDKLYKSSSWTDVERGLLTHREAIKRWGEEGMETINVPIAMNTVNLRLFFFYDFVGREADATEFFEAVTNYLANRQLSRGAPVAIYSREDLRSIIEKADRKLISGWATNAASPAKLELNGASP